MSARKRSVAFLAGVVLTALSTAEVGPASADDVVCGQVITQNTTLHEDVRPCPGNDDNPNDGVPPYALKIAASNITLDLNGHDVAGVTTPGDGVGILVQDVTGVTIKNGEIKHFDAGILVLRGGSHTMTGLTLYRNIGPQEVDAGDAPQCLSDVEADLVQCITSFRITEGPNFIGDGIVIRNSPNNVVRGNEVAFNGPYSGISVLGPASTGTSIDTNDVHDQDVPVVLRLRDRGTGRVVRYDYGIALGVADGGVPKGSRASVTNNQVTRSLNQGIFVGVNDSVLSRNQVSSSGFVTPSPTTVAGDNGRIPGTGIHMEGSRNRVESNTVMLNGYHGIYLSSGDNNQILNNDARFNGNTAAETVGTSIGATFEGDSDLKDQKTNCGTNIWRGNRFITANPACTRG